MRHAAPAKSAPMSSQAVAAGTCVYKATKNAGIDAARPWCCGGLLQRGVMHFPNIWARVDIGRYNLTYLVSWVIACLLLILLRHYGIVLSNNIAVNRLD